MCGICGDMNGHDRDDKEDDNSANTCRKWKAPSADEDRYAFICAEREEDAL